MSRKWIVGLVLLLAVGGCTVIPGCDKEDLPTPEEYQKIAAEVQRYNQTVQDLEPLLGDIAATVESGGMLTEEQREKVQHFQEELRKVGTDASAVTGAVSEHEYVAKDEIMALLETLQVGNAASAPFNPYAAQIAAVLTALKMLIPLAVGAGGLLFGAKKAKDASASEQARVESDKSLEEVVAGTEQYKREAVQSEDTKKAFAAAQNASQSVTTRKKVAAIQRTLAA